MLAQGEHYVRAVAADDGHVYAGLLEKRLLMRIDRASGAVRQLAEGGAAIGTVALNGDRVLAAAGGELIDVRKDGTDLRRVTAESGADLRPLTRCPPVTIVPPPDTM